MRAHTHSFNDLDLEISVHVSPFSDFPKQADSCAVPCLYFWLILSLLYSLGTNGSGENSNKQPTLPIKIMLGQQQPPTAANNNNNAVHAIREHGLELCLHATSIAKILQQQQASNRGETESWMRQTAKKR